MIILPRSTTSLYKKPLLLSSKRHFFLSRFQSPSISINNESSVDHDSKQLEPIQNNITSIPLMKITTTPTRPRPTSLISLEQKQRFNGLENSQLKQLEESILSKLNNLQIDKTFDGSSDLYLLKKPTFTKPFLNPIDLHILENSKIMSPTTRFNTQNYLTSRILKFHDKFLKNNIYYDYKYDLINKLNPIEDLKILNKFIKHLTLSNYQNSNERIKSFIKNRIIFSNNNELLFNNNKELSYLLIDYFLKNHDYSSVLIVKKVIELMGSWDTFSLNIYLKNLVQPHFNSCQNLNVLDNILSSFMTNNVKLNKTSIYLIYSHIQKLNQLSLFEDESLAVLKYQLQKKLLEENLVNNHTITAIIVEDISRSFNLLQNCYMQNDLTSKIQLDILDSINLLSKFRTTENLKISRENLTSKSFRKLFSSIKYKDMNSFNSLISIHLSVHNWKFTWDSIISNYNLLNDHNLSIKNPISKDLKTELLRKNSSTKYTDFGRIFNYNLYTFKNYIKTSANYNLLSHLSANSNWQLFIRSLNDFDSMTNNDGLSYSVYQRSLNHLLDTKLTKSNLDSLTYLILIKFLLHKSLSSNMGSVKRTDVLFIKFQSKIDSIFDAEFRKFNLQSWLLKRSSVRTELENSVSSDNKLFESCFQTNIQPTGVNTKEFGDKPTTSSTSVFISPDLSIITPFEKFLFNRISKLKVLDSNEKVNSEYAEYSEFWDLKNIDLKDVQVNYHLGFINQSYKNDMIKWENISSIKTRDGLSSNLSNSRSNEYQALNLNSLKINKLNKLNDVINENLTLLNKTEDFIVMSRTPSNPKFTPLNLRSSLNNILPNDWLHIVLQKALNDWIVNQLVKKD